MNRETRPTSSSCRLSEDDIYLFGEGTHVRLYRKLGAHLTLERGKAGTRFAVWAPNAEEVDVVGDFNAWTPGKDRLHPHGASGIWEGFVAGARAGEQYKYHIRPRGTRVWLDKADPYAVFAETPPGTASVIWALDYEWHDAEWMKNRWSRNALDAPISIYEVHLGSWMRNAAKTPTYRELAPQLADYVVRLGFTHVEFLPIMEHPFYGSWGYQVTGYFAPSSRYGTPQDFMALIDHLHERGIGVLLDWVPSHFPKDAHGLARFDGTCLYEHEDPRQGLHPDWDSLIFNYGRREVPAFLASSALFWLDLYHADGLRVDAVASMLYLDYSRREGEWIPNRHGGRENLEAIDFLRRLNQAVYSDYPDVQTIAEESTAWPMVSRPTYAGGLGFGMKWDMGWMHDMLLYMSKDPVHRRFHHNLLTFRLLYAFHENFVLSLSHDEVVHGKSSLLGRMPGDTWQKFANLRLLYGTMYGQPGKKLLFMGGEFGQWSEWSHEEGLDWRALEGDLHRQLQQWVVDLNALLRTTPALHRRDFDSSGFQWIDCSDADASIVGFLRTADDAAPVAVVANYTPIPRFDYRVGIPAPGFWKELLNSDARIYGGSGVGNLGGVVAADVPLHGQPYSVSLSLPPLGIVFLSATHGQKEDDSPAPIGL
ncbi:MAG: 1,4-alpha-glucan branching protein GlgB [Candidatus Bipolaricaulota bacterium]